MSGMIMVEMVPSANVALGWKADRMSYPASKTAVSKRLIKMEC